MEILEVVKEYIKPELLILIPVLYLVGVCLKNMATFNNKYIPLLLGIISIIFTNLYLFATADFNCAKDVMLIIFTALTQGILLAGASVYANQLYQQSQK